MENTADRLAQEALSILLEQPLMRQAVVLCAIHLTVVATRIHKQQKRARSESFVVTIGKPNYANKRRIAVLLRRGETLPAVLTYPFPKRHR